VACQSIEPSLECFFKQLLFAGSAVKNGAVGPGLEKQVVLPLGSYLFKQERQSLTESECASIASDLQKDGLWERLSLEDTLYIRLLYEDESRVTQVLRPFMRKA
jgi:hypothetical protein